VEGLLKFLANKIFEKKCCIHYDYNKCGNFKTGQAVQLHMVDKNHCFMNQDYFQEYNRFYDFKEENERIAKKLEEKYKDSKGGIEFDYEIQEGPKEDSDWEDIDSDPENIGVEIKAKNSNKIYKLRRAKLLDNDELLLPSGKIAGHKKYFSIYKQKP